MQQPRARACRTQQLRLHAEDASPRSSQDQAGTKSRKPKLRSIHCRPGRLIHIRPTHPTASKFCRARLAPFMPNGLRDGGGGGRGKSMALGSGSPRIASMVELHWNAMELDIWSPPLVPRGRSQIRRVVIDRQQPKSVVTSHTHTLSPRSSALLREASTPRHSAQAGSASGSSPACS
jgi:hypothetical protein